MISVEVHRTVISEFMMQYKKRAQKKSIRLKYKKKVDKSSVQGIAQDCDWGLTQKKADLFFSVTKKKFKVLNSHSS